MTRIALFPWTNGSDEFFSSSEQIVDTQIDLKDGNDRITINDNYIGLWIDQTGDLSTGLGDDKIQVNSLGGTYGIGIDGSLSMGLGNDVVTSNGTWIYGIELYGSLDLGPGDNTILATATSRPLLLWGGSITAREGNDTITGFHLRAPRKIQIDVISRLIQLS